MRHRARPPRPSLPIPATGTDQASLLAVTSSLQRFRSPVSLPFLRTQQLQKTSELVDGNRVASLARFSGSRLQLSPPSTTSAEHGIDLTQLMSKMEPLVNFEPNSMIDASFWAAFIFRPPWTAATAAVRRHSCEAPRDRTLFSPR
ncbi:hypothetical protein JCGZ_06561 [Jatropha curcas]|uniref:Uncharacterized protein n=1 Tax=Jatropha curcas TaxID=180498 RepID=A0A067LHF9_JATCU|nr:hypothetical protein JCGZ_06561 [Jatropha curcas]